ncbi:ribulose-phosphate 3-epimerase [Granulicatella sp. zg-ZJ]|uniref:ribulose-phosphate 3-epimerase n=1 Tax=unclassified Granulicatella TaxID=2630493 RepID=UPI0013C17FF1|nr:MULTISPECIES: ribulose-phosphate 3-epimerase [unclassified Granulicatella]NEW62795.1 ribulose-phosphate 3-epimerase [Granulicatella sp. zg-ZJ]NEW65419.1 ribulose-phosphate 3-epimerase [Granulicatella sp. zg-84]QMI85216.1 ribulose-phosphate 3-epimerase [Carnobacteriaceae bacterium zg-84]
MQVAPSILSADFANLERDVKLVEHYGVDLIHIDAMDGHFVPNLTLGPNIVEALRKVTNLPLDCHLMISNPDQYIDAFAKAGADIISVHYEACTHLHRVLQQIKQAGVKSGVVINPATPVSAIEPILADVDLVLVMTVNPGFGGQAFITSTLDKIRQLDTLRKERKYTYVIEVDGGINDKTAQLCHEAGVDIVVAGSYIYNAPNIEQAILSLKAVQ